MFEPKYVIDDELLNLVVRLEVTRSKLVDLNLTDEWEQKFRKEALVRRIFCGLRMGSERLSVVNIEKIISLDPERDEDARQLAKQLKLKSKDRAVQLAVNLLNADKALLQLIRFKRKGYQIELSEKELKQIHALVGERLVLAHELSIYRKIPMLTPDGWWSPQPIELEYQLEALFLWLKRMEQNKIYTVFKWAIFYAELRRIYPFSYGSNLVAALALRLGLCLDGYDNRLCLAIEEMLEKEAVRIRKLVKLLIQGEVWDEYLRLFVEMLSDLFEDQYMRMKRVALAWNEKELKQMVIKRGRSKRIALSERQAILLREIELKGALSMSKARELLPSVSDDTLWRDLRDLIEKRLVMKKGKTKGVRYLLSK